jgi:hypothetical protein
MGTAQKKNLTPRKAWEDRFRTPTADDLVGGMNKQIASLVEAARERLMAVPGVREDLAWQGLPWRWTLVYRQPLDNGRGWVYLVPDPAKPLLAMPLTADAVAALPLNRLKKHVKDGVTQARLVDSVYWATWEITGKTQLTEILELVHHKSLQRTNTAAATGKPPPPSKTAPGTPSTSSAKHR